MLRVLRPALAISVIALVGACSDDVRPVALPASIERAPEPKRFEVVTTFAAPVHLSVIRARFGAKTTSGIPTAYRWEVRRTCSDEFTTLVQEDIPVAAGTALPTRRSWFVDTEACALRLSVDRTNGGEPVVREVVPVEGANDVLRGAHASDDGAHEGFSASAAIDGSYGSRWAGAPGKGRWTLTVRLPSATSIDRVRMVLGFDAATRARAVGRTYGIAWGPSRYVLEGSDDGVRFETLATTPVRADGSIVPLRRRLVKFTPRSFTTLRLVIDGATGASGALDPSAAPVVRELSAYRADDLRPVIAPAWVLSVNANPAGVSHGKRGGELANDVYFAKFVQQRFAGWMPSMRRDDRFARAMGPTGELLDAAPGETPGEALESIEGDDPMLDTRLLAEQSPPPIAVLSGSNEWEFARTTGPSATAPGRWMWNPMRPAGGMGNLYSAVKGRVAPMIGLCGGAQILALLEAKRAEVTTPDEDLRTIDQILRRTTGVPIRGFAPWSAVDFAWPGSNDPRTRVELDPSDPLLQDIGRRVTHAFPESHADVVRPEAFAGPLERFKVIARSNFCGPQVTGKDGAFADPRGHGQCTVVPELFVSRGEGYPIIGTQFHAEQRDFTEAAEGDPPESVADARLLLAAAYEEAIDAQLRRR